LGELRGALRLEPLAVGDELLALPRKVPRPFLLLAGHADDSQLVRVAIQVTRQPLAQGERVARVGLHPGTRLVQLARRDDHAVRPRRLQPPAQPEAEPARLIDHVDRVPRAQQRFHPRRELPGQEAPRGLGRAVPVLRHHDVKPRVDVHPELDDRSRRRFCRLARGLDLLCSGNALRKCARPVLINDVFFHIQGEIPNSPAPSHVIYALQRTATLAFSYRGAALTSTGSVTAGAPAIKPRTCRAFASRRFAPTRASGSRSLSLGSLGVARVHSMKTIAITILSLILGATVFAEPLQVEISARYEGFDRSYLETANPNKEHKPGNVLWAPRVTTKSGQRVEIEMFQEVQVPETPNGEKTVNSGLTLDLLPVVKGSQITLSAKSVWRRRLAQDAAQPLGALSFATHETFFGGVVQNGKELTIAVGDGPNDKARLILTVRLVIPTVAPAK